MNQIPGLVWVVIGVGLAVATPWLIYVALDRNSRDRTAQVWQASMDTLNKTLHSENKEADELARRVEALKNQNQEIKNEQQDHQP